MSPFRRSGAKAPLTDYELGTTHSRNPLARLSHRARTAKALALIARCLPQNGTMLDFGCAHGELLQRVRAERPDARLYGLDPFQSAGDGYTHLRSLADCKAKTFDLISAFEVIEHLDEPACGEFFRLVYGHLAPAGIVLMSVPNMLGPALVPKLLHGAFGHGSAHHYSWREALHSVVLLKAPPRLHANRAGTMRHKGYDWRVTRARIAQEFQIVSETFTPFPWLWWAMNSQWFCAFRPRP